MPRLLITGGDGSERAVELTERTIQIGRGPGNDVVLPDPNSGVSRSHAELRFRNGRCVIVDLHSQNGTFLNGERIEHAEIPHDGEVTIGTYRLRLHAVAPSRSAAVEETRHAPPASTVGIGRMGPVLPDAELPDYTLVRPPGEMGRSSDAASGLSRPTLIGGSVIAVALAVLVWVYAASPAEEPTPALAMPDAAPVAAEAVVSEPPSTPVAPLPARDMGSTLDVASSPAVREPPTRPGTTARSNGSSGPGSRFDGSLVARRPGESADAWRARTAAFQTRYAYSRAALDRGDFAAAAGGFEAILQEEPGFLDVPQLLVRARAGLREVARDIFEAGKRLDVAGDWLGALQKFEQAGQIHPDVRGLPEAINRVREKLRAAGESAFNRARRFDESGRWGDALKEYEKAVQWLPSDDPRWEMAQSSVERLKRVVR